MVDGGHCTTTLALLVPLITTLVAVASPPPPTAPTGSIYTGGKRYAGFYQGTLGPSVITADRGSKPMLGTSGTLGLLFDLSHNPTGWSPHAALGLRLTSEMAFGDGPGRTAVTDGFVDLWAQGRIGGVRGGNFTYVAAALGPTLFFGNFAHECAAIGVQPAYGFGLGSVWKVQDRVALGFEANASPFPAIGIESWRWGIHVAVHLLPRSKAR